MMRAFEASWFSHHRERMACWHRDRLAEALEDVRRMEAEILELEQEIVNQRSTTPTHVHVTASLEGAPMSSFAPGQTITFTAVSDNAEGLAVADAYTWATTAGTVVDGADSTSITISDAPLGDLTVTATDPAGISGTVTVTIADTTPASVTVTAS
jgi:hypothetical protein